MKNKNKRWNLSSRARRRSNTIEFFFCHGEKKRTLEQVREAGGGHKGSQTSAGRCCHTAWLELKSGEQDFHMGFSMWGHSKVFHLIVQDVQDLSVHSFSWSMAEGVWDLLSEWKRIKYSVSMVRRYKRESIIFLCGVWKKSKYFWV